LPTVKCQDGNVAKPFIIRRVNADIGSDSRTCFNELLFPDSGDLNIIKELMSNLALYIIEGYAVFGNA
jgi:hypothetical protein